MPIRRRDQDRLAERPPNPTHIRTSGWCKDYQCLCAHGDVFCEAIGLYWPPDPLHIALLGVTDFRFTPTLLNRHAYFSPVRQSGAWYKCGILSAASIRILTNSATKMLHRSAWRTCHHRRTCQPRDIPYGANSKPKWRLNPRGHHDGRSTANSGKKYHSRCCTAGW